MTVKHFPASKVRTIKGYINFEGDLILKLPSTLHASPEGNAINICGETGDVSFTVWDHRASKGVIYTGDTVNIEF